MLGSSPAGITEWPLGLKVRTAASQAANVEFKSRRGHLWAGRIVAIAADCKSADFGLRWFESNPAHFCTYSQVGKATDCNSVRRRFESYYVLIAL